jgi:Cutinase
MLGRFHARVVAAVPIIVCLSPGALALRPAQGPPPDLRNQLTTDGFLKTELSAIVLNEYPYADYVLAFNRGDRVFFALDPTRFPSVAGRTVDLYIVDHHTEAQWLADRTLTDVRGAPQTETLGTTTIQSCTFFLTGSNALSGDVGLDIGQPFDIVCDANQDGLLDGGDLIDGFGDVAGFYVFVDTAGSGPLPVTELQYNVQAGTVTAGFEGEDLFYPTTVAALGELPLIVVSHGNGHDYRWYSHIGQHMASWGYVVMSHRNNTVPGVETAATTTLEHTDAFLGQLATIAGGVLQGHVDSHRIVWIGHSRGGEGVVIAYDRLKDGVWNPVHYSIGDIRLISSIAPTDFQGPGNTNPHEVVFSLWTGGADADVDGCALSDVAQTFHLHDRALRWRQSISLHGVGHGDFHNGNASEFATGPCLVGRPDTHKIMKGYLLPLVKHYVENNVAARDFLWRQWEQFHPIGAPTSSCVNVDLMFREDPSQTFVVDDYQTQSSAITSSSGGAVSFSVTGLTEGRLDDANADFTNNAGDVMNGMTEARSVDASRGIVFDWNADTYYVEGIVPGERDLTDDVYLSFRACQATRHPNTAAELADLDFTVTLVDGSMGSSSIRIGAYGGGIEEPYQRNNCGTGFGWDNEWETVRIRLTDFLTNGSGLDLSNVIAIRFEFGPSFGSALGRIGLDDITISRDPAQPYVAPQIATR